jgi:polar amino acid transport system substrate-binding protein
MKQVLQSYRTGELRVADVPAPGVEAGSLLVHTRVSLVSAGTERATVELAQKSLLGKARARPDLVKKVLERVARDGLVATGKAAFQKLDSPIPLGYSCAGVVLEVGGNVPGFSVGDRVACAGAKVANHAEINLVPHHLCARIPDGVADEDAAFVTLGAIALHGVRQASPTLGEVFAVIGLGLIGQLAVQLLRASGCAVLGVDLDPVKVTLARSLGCEAALLRSDDLGAAVRGLTSGRGLDGVILAAATPSSDPIELAGELCRDRGRVVALGATGLTVPRRPYYDKELVLLQSRSYGPGRYDPSYEEGGVDYPAGYVRWTEGRNLEAFLAQVAAGRVRAQPLVSHKFPIERAQEAYGLLQGAAAAEDSLVAQPAPGQAAGDVAAKPPAPAGEPLGILLTYPQGPAPARTVTVTNGSWRASKGVVRVGIIGAGNFASGTLVPLFAQQDGVKLTAIASARGASARHLAERYQIARATTDAEAILSDGEVDAVVIATRHDKHAALAAQALRAGKHVFVEKPLALDEAGLQDVLAAQAGSGKQLFVGYNRRFAPMTLLLKEQFANRRSPLVLSLRINAGEIPATSWVHDPREGGGRLVGEGCHFVDLCAAIAGAPVTRVFAQGVLPSGGARADDNFALDLRLGDGSIASLVYTAQGDPSAGKERIEVFGDGAWGLLDEFRKLELRRAGQLRTERALAQDKGHRAGVAAFIESITTGQPAVPAQDLAATSRATFAAAEALRGGDAVAIEVAR